MKVLFVSHSADRGGAELCLVELVEVLSKRGIDCSCLLPGYGPLSELLDETDAQVTVVPFKNWVGVNRSAPKRAWSTLRNLRTVLPVARAIERTGCDVVYTNTIATCVGAVAAKLLRVPHVWHIHEYGLEDHGLEFDLGDRRSKQLIGWLSSACIANSQDVADVYRPHLAGTRLSVVYNSVPVPPLAGPAPMDLPWQHEGSIRCVMLGALQPRKGQTDAIQAVAKLRQMNVPAELLLMGNCSPDYRAEIDGVIERLNLTDWVHMLGFSSQPMPLVNSADVLLMCSRREAFGRVTVEGMKLGLPVVGAHSGGTPEIVQHGETGYLYTPGDVKQLATRIADLAQDPETRQRMGINGRHSANARFNQERYGTGIEDVLSQVVSERNPGDRVRKRHAA